MAQSMDAGAGAGAVAEARRMIKLHLVRGSFFAASPGDGGAAAMVVEVWCRLPEDLIWRVVRFVPAAAHFRWQLVSREWRRVLNSAEFRSRVAMAQQEWHGAGTVVACVTPGNVSGLYTGIKEVEIDLSSFVPASFWTSRSYTVEAAADGLVVISNDNERNYWEQHAQLMSRRKPRERFRNQYCVINPVTRWCRVLPPVPSELEPTGDWWMPPVAATHIGTIGFFGSNNDVSDGGGELCMATCDLAPGGSGEWEMAEDWFSLEYTNPAVEARKCEMYVRFQRQVLVLVPRPGTGRRLVEVESLEEPWLGVDDAALARHFFATLVTHRGAVFLVVGLEQASTGASAVPVEVLLQCDVGVRVWRLVRERNVWEPVARLGAAVAQRLAGVVERVLDDDLRLVEASGVREFLCCHVRLRTREFMLGVNLNTGGWELVHREPSLLCTELEREDFVSTSYRAAKMVELRPDLFL